MGCLSTWQQLPHERDHSPDSAQSGLDNKASVCAESYGEDDEAAGVKGVCQLGTLSPSGPLPFCRSSPASAALVSLHLSLLRGPCTLVFLPMRLFVSLLCRFSLSLSLSLSPCCCPSLHFCPLSQAACGPLYLSSPTPFPFSLVFVTFSHLLPHLSHVLAFSPS